MNSGLWLVCRGPCAGHERAVGHFGSHTHQCHWSNTRDLLGGEIMKHPFPERALQTANACLQAEKSSTHSHLAFSNVPYPRSTHQGSTYSGRVISATKLMVAVFGKPWQLPGFATRRFRAPSRPAKVHYNWLPQSDTLTATRVPKTPQAPARQVLPAA